MTRLPLVTAIAIVLCFPLAPQARAADGKVKVFILAGQSNMEGQGVVAMDHERYYNGGKGNLVHVMKHSPQARRYAHLRDAAGKWVEREDVWVRFKTHRGELKKGRLGIGYTGYGGREHMGPELQFGHVMGDHFREQVLLIKTAWGGKSLHKDFRPPSSGGQVGPFYTQMIAEVREALARLGDEFPRLGGRKCEIAGFVWFQGWNDMFDEAARSEYARNLANLIRDVRKEFESPDLPVVVGETGNGSNMAVRGAQAAVPRMAEFRGTVAFVPTRRFLRPKEQSPNVGHGHHWFGNAESYFLIGDEFGRAMKALLRRKGRVRRAPPVPDLTAGGKPDDRHDWNLGATGARGWIWGWNLETADSRQILITKVDKHAPADGMLAVGDVILGIDGKPFAADARKAFARAVSEAERTGTLSLVRWRGGKRQDVRIELPVLGACADTAPYGCAKSRKILEAGCRHIAANMKGGIDGTVNALALLASGIEAHQPTVRRYARRLGSPDLKLRLHSSSGMASWHWGYTCLFLSEYYLATGDEAVLPAIRQYAVNIAKGQSGVGSWGHGMAWPELHGGNLHGRLGGYGALNQAGLICHLSLVLADKCGVRNREVRRAIGRANRFFGFYIGKGAVPYGDHRPGWQVHDDNGKDSIAAVLFDLQGHRAGARFFSRMTVASYGERERGHTGNYFSFLWGALGAGRAGPEAAAAFLRELRWFYDLARRPDGSFVYQGGAGMGGAEHKYGDYDCTGAFLLTYALPAGRLHVTGKGVDASNALAGDELRAVVEAGRGFDSWGLGLEPYRAKTTAQLLACLRSWSPAVRHRAAVALAERPECPVARLVAMLDDEDVNARYGACRALGGLKAKAAPAVGKLRKLLAHNDVWLRIQASYALADIGPPARPAAADMLAAAVRTDPNDPRGFTQRYLSFALFYPGGALGMVGLRAHDLDGVDRKRLYPAVEALLRNEDGRARACIGSVYKQLRYDEIRPLLPAVLRAIEQPAPSGVMFASNIRLAGLKLLARHRVREGMAACLALARDQNPWASEKRTPEIMTILKSYGAHAKEMIPQLRQLKEVFAKVQPFPANLTRQKIECVDETIRAIEASTDRPKLRGLTSRP